MSTKSGMTKPTRKTTATFWQGLILAVALMGYVLLVGVLARQDAAGQEAKADAATPTPPPTQRLAVRPTWTLPPLRVPALPPLAVTPEPLRAPAAVMWVPPAQDGGPVGGNNGSASAVVAPPPMPTLPPPAIQPLPTVAPVQMPVVQPVPVVRSRGS